ncbi:MAG: hypothetical protein KME15_21960 [Drouetiella hepatica Uher 2000/2452]|uniref:DUF998 domain-containing protein n=1 Tax=Drouetiella hepatica Uher 2000/2452 TaxID=904376 RepID=A0A951QEP0_9CYAN|nr:hypothetical protein [Drouetiella hepatica Uher 2000/2452]
MKDKSAKTVVRKANLLLYASAQFIVLTIAAMFTYPGSAKFEPQSDRYLFFQNFFSDLGATKTYSGLSNTTSMVMFIVALSSVGLALLVFSTTWKSIANREGDRIFGYAAQVFAVLSGLCFIGIAATPWDLILSAHNSFVKAAFSLLLGFIVCLSALQMRNLWRKQYLVLNLLYLVILSIYIGILFYGPDLTTREGLEFQVAAQKIIVYVSVLNLGFQALGIRQSASLS